MGASDDENDGDVIISAHYEFSNCGRGRGDDKVEVWRWYMAFVMVASTNQKAAAVSQPVCWRGICICICICICMGMPWPCCCGKCICGGAAMQKVQ